MNIQLVNILCGILLGGLSALGVIFSAFVLWAVIMLAFEAATWAGILVLVAVVVGIILGVSHAVLGP